MAMKLPRQTLIGLGGLQFTGKSTVGRAELGIPSISLDGIRHLFWPGNSGRGNIKVDLQHRNLASPVFTAVVESYFKQGESLIIERIFAVREYQEWMLNIADAHGSAPFKLIMLKVPDDREEAVLTERAAQRSPDDPSPASSWDDCKRVKDTFEWPRIPHLVVDPTQPLSTCVEQILAYVAA